MKAIVKSFEVGGQTITVETGKLAKQSDGAVVVKWATPCCWPQ
jgi:polyribonucleotide nucleotidyltransferase